MKHIDNYLNQEGRQSTSTQPTGDYSDEIDIETKRLFNRIFKELVAIYPAWRQAFDNEEAVGASKRQWAKGIQENGINQWEVIEGALAHCRASGGAFMPSIGQFIGYCHKAAMERMGALETMAAYHHLLAYFTKSVDIREPCDLDPFVYHTISQAGFDTYRFRTEMTAESSVKYFSEQYRETIRHASTGGALKAPIKKEHRIENPTGVTHGNSEDIARKTLDDLKRMLKEK
jgi:hypothetical protein